MQNMSDNIAKSCKLSHTILICNIKSLTCTKLEKIEFAQKLPKNCPGMPKSQQARYLANQFFSGPEIFRDGSSHYFLLLLKFSAKCNDFSRDMGQKPHFGPILGPNLGQDIFFSKIGLRHFKSFIKGLLDAKNQTDGADYIGPEASPKIS